MESDEDSGDESDDESSSSASSSAWSSSASSFVCTLGALDDVVAVPTHAGPSALFSSDGGLSSQRKQGAKGRFKYFVGIIDILQQYTNAKRAEVGSRPFFIFTFFDVFILLFKNLNSFLFEYASRIFCVLAPNPFSLQTFFKSFGSDSRRISCVPPPTYGARFVKFIGDNVE